MLNLWFALVVKVLIGIRRKKTMVNNIVDKKEYGLLFECICSDQVPLEDMVFYFKDEGFKKYYLKRKDKKK